MYTSFKIYKYNCIIDTLKYGIFTFKLKIYSFKRKRKRPIR